MSSSNWVTKILVPTMGVILANTMWVAPLKDVYMARVVNKQLGSLNPVPFTMVLINCIGWVMYSILVNDIFLYFGNCFGVLIGLFCSSSAMLMLVQSQDFKPSENEKKLTILVETIMMSGMAFWMFMLLIVGIILKGEYPSSLMVGIISDCIAIGYYAAPLSTIYMVIKTSNATSLHVPTIIANFMNATLWFIYGLAGINDILVWLPNAIGLLLSISQLIVVLIYNPKGFYCDITKCCFSCTSSESSMSQPQSYSPTATGPLTVRQDSALDTTSLTKRDDYVGGGGDKLQNNNLEIVLEESKQTDGNALSLGPAAAMHATSDVENNNINNNKSKNSEIKFRNLMSGWRKSSVEFVTKSKSNSVSRNS